MSRSYKGRGVVLHTLKYGESQMIVHLLTDVGGRQSYMASGVGRGRGSKAALFQPLFALEFEGQRPAKGEMHRFRELRSGIVLRKTPFDVSRSAIALFIAEVLYRLVREQESNIALFNFVWASVDALDKIEGGVANFHLWFLAHLSVELGFMPHGEWSEGAVIDRREGAFVRVAPRHGECIDSADARLFYDLLRCDVAELGAIELGRERRTHFLESLLEYYAHHLDAIHAVRSIDILKELF